MVKECLFFSGGFLQKLQRIFLGLFGRLACCAGGFLESLVRDIFRISHIVVRSLASAVVAHTALLPRITSSALRETRPAAHPVKCRAT